MTITSQVLTDLPSTFLQADVTLQTHETRQSPFAYFKTSHRPHLQFGEHEVIYYNSSGELLETSIGNLVL